MTFTEREMFSLMKAKASELAAAHCNISLAFGVRERQPHLRVIPEFIVAREGASDVNPHSCFHRERLRTPKVRNMKTPVDRMYRSRILRHSTVPGNEVREAMLRAAGLFCAVRKPIARNRVPQEL